VERMTGHKTDRTAFKLATFFIGDECFGIDILKVQEISKVVQMTPVPLAQPYVKGVLNMRGQVVTVIDVARKLGLPSTEGGIKKRNIIVKSKGEHIGLLVEEIGDVIEADRDTIEKAPTCGSTETGSLITGILKTEDSLIGILDLDELLREETAL
jgi:purine-binding chemotaxis protein CheW